MVEKPKSVKQITVTKRVPFRVASASAGLFRVIERIPPLSISNVLHIQNWWGLNETPVDDDVLELYLMAFDTDLPPDIIGVRDQALWSAAQRWAVGGGTGFAVQLLEHENSSVIAGAVANTELADRTRNFAWSFFLVNTSGSSVLLLGTLVIQHTLFQRNWRSDSYTWNGDPDVVNRDGVSEVDMDVS